MDKVKKVSDKAQEANWHEIRDILQDETESILSLRSSKANEASPQGLQVILIVGVNGVGKTTTIGKIAAHYLAKDQKVMLCAGDTFRAAAIEQLKVWGERLKLQVIAHKEGSDPGAVAFDAVKAAKARGVDILLIDTAGRLHNKANLMDELAKVKKVVGKDLAGAPHETYLVLDATTGQNAFQQVRAFKEIVDVSGLCITKLDGTAKGGVIIGIANEFDIPIRYIGVGEKASDLREFDPKAFAKSLFGDESPQTTSQ